MSTPREGRLPIKTEVIDPDLRKGKWTAEEENYANKIISLFNQGMLPVVVGTTLRTYLSDKLRCDPMRITKKYAGASCIGKQVFQLADNYYECFQENERELQRLEALFLARINGKTLGLAGKRNGSSDALLSSHQSIYETNNLERSSTVQAHTTPPLARRSPKSYRGGGGRGFHGRGSAGRVASSPGKYRRKQTAINDALYFGAGGDMSGVGGEGIAERMSRFSDAGASEEEDDYSYAYDPEYDDYDYEHPHISSAHGGDAARQYFATHGISYSLAPQGVVNTRTGSSGHVYTSLGRRILSEPNLTELNLSSWKETDYRPLPADSLKELFSQPIAPAHQHDGFHDDTGTDTATLLPEHVYTALGTESGRYAATGRPYMSPAAIAARAQATKKALIESQRNNATAGSKASNGGYLSKETADMQQQSAQFSSLYAKKRSYSAMALVDFEKLAGDDNAAGDLFLQFLTKIGSGNTPPSTESVPSPPPAHTASVPTTAISATFPPEENKDDLGTDATTAPADSSGASLSAGSYSPVSLSATAAAAVTAGSSSSTATVTMEDNASVPPSSPGRYAHSGSLGSDSEATTTSMQIA